MAAPTISHVIFVGALIGLIFAMQFFYMNVVENVWEEMARRELKEITDYVSDTISNLYFLANSTNYLNVTLQKTLNLPSEIAGLSYVIQIVNGTSNFAQGVQAYLENRAWLNATSWLPPGLTIGQANQSIRSSDRTVVAGCRRTGPSTYVWMAFG